MALADHQVAVSAMTTTGIAPSTTVALICQGRSAIAEEYSAWKRSVMEAGANIRRLVSGMVSQPNSGEIV
jgi:hypothetical protein